MGGRSKSVNTVSLIVSANLRRLRIAQHMTLQVLSDKMNAYGQTSCTQAQLSKIELGEQLVTVDYLASAASALGVPPGDLLKPFVCAVCQGTPPAGFTCNTCGARGEA